jgi:UDP-glucose 4-epimerase
MKQKLLVTGAGGYIGSIAAQLLLTTGYEVVAVDNLSTGFAAPLRQLQNTFGKNQFRWYKCDISNVKKVFEKESDIYAVLHFAAHTIVDESVQNPTKYFANNACKPVELLDTMARHNTKNIIFSSTAAIYGESRYNPVDEAHPIAPENPYGASKYAAERVIQWYEGLGITHVILRYFNVCGASDDGTLGNAQQPSYALVHNAVKGALGIEPFELTCAKVDTNDHTPIRDYINVVDLADAHVRALEYLRDGGTSEIINLGTETGNSVLEIVTAVERATGTSIPRTIGKKRKGECAKVVASNKKAQRLLGWTPAHTLYWSIESTVSWLMSNPAGWSL